MCAKAYRTKINDIEIYAILSPESKQVFIGKTKYPNHYQAYKDHVRLKVLPTKNLFTNASQTQIFPSMYLLERMEATDIEAYGHLIAWTKFFQDKGYEVLAHQKNLDYANDLLDENKLYYLSIKDKSMDEITDETKVMVANYKQTRKTSENKTPSMIGFYVSPEEYEEISKKAEQAGKSMSMYCKQTVMNGAIVRISFSEFVDELRSIKRVLREIQLGIYQSGKHFPADLENMEKMVERINQNHKHVIRYIDRQYKKLNKMRGEKNDHKNLGD